MARWKVSLAMPASQAAGSATAPEKRRSGAWSIARGLILVLLAALAFLPIVNWIPGGHEADWYGTALDLWQAGTVIVVLLGVLLALAAQRYGAYLNPIGARLAALGTLPALVPAALLVLGAFALYALDATVILSRRPLLIDELIQLYQARIFEQGRLWLPSTGHPELFGAMHLVDQGGRAFGQFPPGGPALLAAGDILGAAWLVGPVCGAVSVLAFLAFLRTTERSRAVRWAAAALFAFAPFTVFMSGSHMNHVFTLTAILVATAALSRAVTAPTPRPWWALLSGLGYGVAATIRPADALAFALPAGIWYLVRAARDRRRAGELAAAGAGVVLPVLLMLWFNARTTGAPLLFGYELLWGKAQNLGFHQAPWGPAHTPLRGLELVNLNLLRLQTYLFESPVPSLVPALAALALVPALTAFDRLLLSSSGLLLLLYFAYWHDGFFLGPRFVYPLAPLLALWTARLPGLVRSRFGRGFTYRFVLAAFAAAAVMALAFQVPARARQYRAGLYTMRWNADSTAAAAGVRGALVLVRESWGSQLIARMWRLGLSRVETERVYRRVDACVLELAVTRAEEAGVRGRAALAALAPLLGDSTRVVPSPYSTDESERYLPGARYPAVCAAKILEDRAGFTLYAPLLLARRNGNVYARDLHALDTAAVALYPSRPIFLLKPATDALGSPPRFHRLSRDSLARAWNVPLSVFDRQAAPASP
jgi:hypothetical protein